MAAEDLLDQPPPLMDDTDEEHDKVGGAGTQEAADCVGVVDWPPPRVDDADEALYCVGNEIGDGAMDAAAGSNLRAPLEVTDAPGAANGGEGACDSDGSGSSGTASDRDDIEAAEYGAYYDAGDLLDAGIDVLSVCETEAPMAQHVFLSSTAARTRAYYEALPEASMAVPVVSASWASRPTRFGSPALRGALRFALTAGGSGLAERDQTRYAATLGLIESEAASGTAAVGPFSAAFPSPRSFLNAVRHETNRVLAVRRWQKVPISVGDNTYTYYFRDILQAGLDALAAANHVSFGDPTNLAAVNLNTGDDEDDARIRHGTLDSDLYLGEWRSVRRMHGGNARVMGVQLHAYEALVSWSGACYMFPVRANFVNVLDNGGGWTTVGHIQHIPKAIEKTAAARLAVSDARNDLFHRCIAVSTRTLARASETGVSAPVGGHGVVRLVPRVVGLVVDQVEERWFYGSWVISAASSVPPAWRIGALTAPCTASRRSTVTPLRRWTPSLRHRSYGRPTPAQAAAARCVRSAADLPLPPRSVPSMASARALPTSTASRRLTCCTYGSLVSFACSHSVCPRPWRACVGAAVARATAPWRLR